ncbi:unnamed protein product [Triticum turgidum subsp. durum]|uniref:glutathione transferase n=1 Tax=Triticum turgidum subsp. durum TaxID=4567 RepID=A0A9R1RXA5_TRITD|nr:unnamed protein product [Triticum turgidum subsp. durum]
MAGLGTGAGAPVVKVYHEKSMILPDVSRVLACLYEKNIEFETVKDSYKDILRLQSTRSVPVPFYDGPTFRQESRAICRYIAETYEQRGYPFLLGKDVLERASIEQWLRHEEHAFDPPSRALFCHLAFPFPDEDMSDIDREKRKLEEVLEVYEQRLGESKFLAGNKFTLADLVHLPNTHHIVTSEEFAYLYDSRKNVQRWWNTISARDSWQQVRTDTDKSTSKDASSPTRPGQGSSKKAPDKLHLSDDEAATLSKPTLSQEAPKPTDQTPYAQQPSEQAKKAAADQKDAAHSPKQVAFRDIQNETAPQARSRGAKDSTKEGREADQKRAASAPTRELPPGSQHTPQATPADLKVSDSSPMKEGAISEDDQFSTKRLRKMLEQSDPAVLKPQSTGMQPPPVQAAGARDPQTPITADERRATSPPKGGMASDDRGATQPRKSPSTNEQQPSPRMPSQSPAGESAAPAPLQAPASDASKSISSKDSSKQTNETLYYRSSETSREMPSSAPEKSMRQQQLQSDKSISSPQDTGKQGSEAAPPVSGTEKPGRTSGQDLLESQEQASPDTQQVKNNRNNSKSDGSSKPTLFDGNKGDVPESQRGGSSTNL